MSTYEEIVAAFGAEDSDDRTAKLTELFAGANLQELHDQAVAEVRGMDLAEVSDEQLAHAKNLVAFAQDLQVRIASAVDRSAQIAAISEFAAAMAEPAAPAAEEAPQQVEEPALVAAKPRTTVDIPFAAMPSTKIVTQEQRKNLYQVFAAADIPGIAAGEDISDLDRIADVAARRMDALRRTGGKSRVQSGIAEIRRNRPRELSLFSSDSEQRAAQVVQYATDPKRLTDKRASDGSLIAAGWCAPSETIYDLCDPASMDGLVDIPEITADRGGVRFPAGLDFSTIYAGVGTQTEAQAIAGDPKTCIDIPCPTFTDVRLDIVYLCVTAPILTNRAYPELIRNFIANSLAAAAHKANQIKLAKMVAASTNLVIDSSDYANQPNYGAATTSLEYVTYAASQIRYRHRLSANAPLEAVFPLWAKEVIRGDLAKKNGVDLFDVSDARINEFFRARNIRVQWVYDWQDALASGTSTDWGGTIPGTGAWPATLSFLVYPAGTFFALTSDVITLDGVYDSAGLAQNEFTALFTEEGVNVAKQCYTSLNVTIPVCVNGLSGAQSAPACSNIQALPAPVTP